MTTYTEIRKITGNNKAYAAAALALTIQENDWITADDTTIVYLKSKSNDWVAIPDCYADEGAEFNTVGGVSVILTDGGSGYVATEAE